MTDPVITDFLIKADHVSVVRKNRRILDDVSVNIAPGEFVTIVGPNGAGKSVLLHVLMGLISTDGGSVVRKDGLRVGYMPQRFMPEATMPLSVVRFLKLTKGATARSIAETLALTGALSVADRPLHVLSGGELQRVLLARALLHDPDLLVLDEPAQNLDVVGELAFYKLLEDIYKKRRCAVLMVSHDLHMVMASTGKVICLFHHVCCSGEPSVVAKDPEFTALFGKDMAKMVSVYQHSHEHDHGHDHSHGHSHKHGQEHDHEH